MCVGHLLDFKWTFVNCPLPYHQICWWPNIVRQVRVEKNQFCYLRICGAFPETRVDNNFDDVGGNVCGALRRPLPSSPHHCTRRSASPARRGFFKRTSHRVSWLDFAATEPLHSLGKPHSSHPPPYLLLLPAVRQSSQIRLGRIQQMNTFVFQLLVAIRQLSASSVPTFLCVFLRFAALGVWMSYVAFLLSFKTV